MKGLSLIDKRLRYYVTPWALSDYIRHHDPLIDAVSWVDTPLSCRAPRIPYAYLALRSAYHRPYRTTIKFKTLESEKLDNYAHNNRFSDEHFNDLLLEFEDVDENFNNLRGINSY